MWSGGAKDLLAFDCDRCGKPVHLVGRYWRHGQDPDRVRYAVAP